MAGHRRWPFPNSLLAAALLTIGSSSASYATPFPIAVKASGNEAANPPLNAADGIASTRWSCIMTAAPCWFRADTGSAKSISNVSITWYSGGLLKYNYSIAVAGSDFNYKTVASGTSAGNTTAPESYSFAAVSGQYVKITVSDNSTHNGTASIVDVAVSGAASPSPTPIPTSDAGQRDTFGIVKKYGSAPNGKSWTSAHWANNKARYITARDPDDPTGVSESRSDQAQLYVDGKGVLQFKGSSNASEPRFHLNGGANFFFQNVEVTFYYLKEQDYDVDWGGMVIGARSGPEGHSTQFCDAHTYYGRFRNDGKYDFEKELKHPASATRNGTNIWNGAPHVPTGQWIGMKYMVYNVTVAGKPGIKLELYRDTTDGANGGTWTKIGETIDTGAWAPPQNSGACTAYPADSVPLTGGGVIVLRNTGVIKDSYKWMSVREISPPVS
jgi:hypothetical protein